MYGQDAWRATDRDDAQPRASLGAVPRDDLGERHHLQFLARQLHNGITSTSFPNAPAGLIYPGRSRVPARHDRAEQAVEESLAARGRRMGCDRQRPHRGAVVLCAQLRLPGRRPSSRRPSQRPPFNNRLDLSGNFPFDDPYRWCRAGHRSTRFRSRLPPTRCFRLRARTPSIDPDINSTRVQSWNVTVEQQIGTHWQVSASYLGSYIDRIWGQVQINPGVFLGLGPCTLNGVSYPDLLDPRESAAAARAVAGESGGGPLLLGASTRSPTVGTQSYRGAEALLPTSRRGRPQPERQLHRVALRDRHARHGRFIQFSAFGYSDPNNPSFDRGNCPFNRRQIAALHGGVRHAAV